MPLRSRHSRRSAYTLVEILVVIGIIVLIIAMGVPLLNVFTGARSVESAQNQLASIINAARNEAITMQRPEGVLFYIDDKNTPDRVSVITVYASEPQSTDNDLRPAPEVMLDTFTDRDPVVLPVGVMMEFLVNRTNTNQERYFGFNPAKIGPTVPIGGVILFDGRGQLSTQTYGLRVGFGSGNGRTWSGLGRLLYSVQGQGGSAANDIVQQAYGQALISQIGFVAFNYEQFKGAGYGVDDPSIASGSGTELPEEQWIDANSTPYMVGRYNGTLVKGE